MKQLTHSVTRCNRRAIAPTLSVICIIFMLALVSPGCQKEITEDEMITSEVRATQPEALTRYMGIPKETMKELQQAKAASARYQVFENALKDGYIDIEVIVPEMGHHYLNPNLVDGIFDYTKPEILVYNPNEKGKMELVAVEYAIPLSESVNAPDGFTGTLDVWNENEGFGLWLLHAWVWSYNPQGVFNPTNPTIHLH